MRAIDMTFFVFYNLQYEFNERETSVKTVTLATPLKPTISPGAAMQPVTTESNHTHF